MWPTSQAANHAQVLRSRARTIASLRRTIGMLERVIDQNRLLAENPDHALSSLGRIAHGEAELGMVRVHLAALESKAGLDR